ncbi:Uncharacterised protein [Legionella hackeliae]|nr:hypothetical protein Lhac_3151 [Legionella hackeliae]STX47094.1 Uncharacterised protein [Legionella hackeliae]
MYSKSPIVQIFLTLASISYAQNRHKEIKSSKINNLKLINFEGKFIEKGLSKNAQTPKLLF